MGALFTKASLVTQVAPAATADGARLCFLRLGKCVRLEFLQEALSDRTTLVVYLRYSLSSEPETFGGTTTQVRTIVEVCITSPAPREDSGLGKI